MGALGALYAIELDVRRAIEHGAMDTLGYDVISGAIKAGSRLAIWLSTRI